MGTSETLCHDGFPFRRPPWGLRLQTLCKEDPCVKSSKLHQQNHLSMGLKLRVAIRDVQFQDRGEKAIN